ncbi:hypothetical protein GCM10025868_17390 [Angustibacter aerolatus]|uniref:HAD family hydrolase n=1 Tax=Angustibacter aerolatus TaxID=1162965 RepID=A0ABQ6JFA8_9ACTN|nr:hypothetical protein GCM10025868_17390 [Angustibacter aerolatus]
MTAALLDVDGTLVDSNYHHVIAWSRAFARHDLHPSLWQIHRAIGMGGDKPGRGRRRRRRRGAPR